MALTSFVAVSYPLSTLAHIVAGQQLAQAKAWRDHVAKAAKEEWKSGKPAAQALTLTLTLALALALTLRLTPNPKA